MENEVYSMSEVDEDEFSEENDQEVNENYKDEDLVEVNPIDEKNGKKSTQDNYENENEFLNLEFENKISESSLDVDDAEIQDESQVLGSLHRNSAVEEFFNQSPYFNPMSNDYSFICTLMWALI